MYVSVHGSVNVCSVCQVICEGFGADEFSLIWQTFVL